MRSIFYQCEYLHRQLFSCSSNHSCESIVENMKSMKCEKYGFYGKQFESFPMFMWYDLLW